MQHIFDVEIATKYGLAEAILLNNLYYWIEHNRANERNFYNGTYWTYNSVKAFKALFPYLSERKIHNALKKLQEQGVIETGNFNENTYDRTLWYSLTKLGYCIMQKCKMDNAKMSNGDSENVKSSYTDINQVKKQDNKTNNQKKKYAEAVMMTEEQYNELLKMLKTDEAVQQWIMKLSDYKMSTGKKYKSDFHTIRNWVNKEPKPAYKPYHQQDIVEKAKQMIGDTPITMPTEEEEAEAIRKFHATGGYA